MSKHTQLSFVSFPSSESGSQVESKAKSRRLDFGSLLRSKKLGAADLSSKKRALDADTDIGGKINNGNAPTSPSQRVKRTRLHSGISIASISNPSRLRASVTKTDPERRRSVDSPTENSRLYFRERTDSASSVRTIRPTDNEEPADARPKVSPSTDKPFNVSPAEPAKPVLTDSDVNLSNDAKLPDDNASPDKCLINADEESPGWLELLSDSDGDSSSKEETNYAFKRLKSVQEFVEVGNDPDCTTSAKEHVQPDVSVKLFKQHIELWDTKPTDVYVYRAQMHMTSPLSAFDPCSSPNVKLLEISCRSLFPSPSREYVTYYTGETTQGRRPQIDPSKGIHIGQRWWHSLPKGSGGTGVKGQWGWYLKMWIPIPMYVMKGREMGVFKVKARAWMGDENVVDVNVQPEPLCAEKEFSVSCLRWTGKSFREPSSSKPPSGFLVPAWSLVTH